MNRKKFFSSFGIGIAGLLLIKSIPFKMMRGKNRKQKVSVKINPLSVKRGKIGGNNG